MAEFNMTSEDYSERNYFELGIHKVKIEGAVLDKMDDGREYVEIAVAGENGESDTTRMWLHTEKAGKFTLRVLQSICVHNAKTEAAKDKVRNAFIGKVDTQKIVGILNKMDGYEAWFQVEQDPVRTYTNSDGDTRPSLNKNVYGYEPTPRKKTKEEMVEELVGGKVEPVEGDDSIPF